MTDTAHHRADIETDGADTGTVFLLKRRAVSMRLEISSRSPEDYRRLAVRVMRYSRVECRVDRMVQAGGFVVDNIMAGSNCFVGDQGIKDAGFQVCAVVGPLDFATEASS